MKQFLTITFSLLLASQTALKATEASIEDDSLPPITQEYIAQMQSSDKSGINAVASSLKIMGDMFLTSAFLTGKNAKGRPVGSDEDAAYFEVPGNIGAQLFSRMFCPKLNDFLNDQFPIYLKDDTSKEMSINYRNAFYRILMSATSVYAWHNLVDFGVGGLQSTHMYKLYNWLVNKGPRVSLNIFNLLPQDNPIINTFINKQTLEQIETLEKQFN